MATTHSVVFSPSSQRSDFRQHTRARIDRAVGRLFAELEYLPLTRLAFANLLLHVRANSPLLQPTGDGSQQLLALEALRNIARHHDDFVQWPSTWRGGQGNVQMLVHDLASHLFGRYPVPRCFAQVWFGRDTADERRSRRWFIEHANGRRFRDIPDLPITLTRKMERILLHSPHHLSLLAAMRRAEILGLGGGLELVDTILASPLAHEREDNDFWRTAIRFFIKHEDELEPAQIHAIIEYLYVFRTSDPNFTLAGRTPASLLRALGLDGHEHSSKAVVTWPSSGWPSMSERDETGEWRMIELQNAWALKLEGQILRHCVYTYVHACARGRSRIWSLRWRGAEGGYAPRCTIEVRKRSRTIAQIRAYQNQRVTGLMRTLIERWAALAGLRIADYAW